MLFNFDNQKPLLLIGQGVCSQEFAKVLIKHSVDWISQVSIEDLDSVAGNSQCIIAIRDIKVRRQIIANFGDQFIWPTFVHGSSDVIDIRFLGKGIWIDSFSAIGSGARLGNFTIVSSYGSVAHNSEVGENCFLAPNTVILGSTKVGDNVYFGSRTTVADHRVIASDTIFSAGSLVHKNVDEPGQYIHNRKIG